MTNPYNVTSPDTDYDIATAVADNAVALASGVSFSLTLMALHLRKSSLDFPSSKERHPLGDGYVSGLEEVSRGNVTAAFLWRTSWNFSGYFAWNDTKNTFNLGPGIQASTTVPMEISFERVRYRKADGSSRWSIENLVVRKGPGEIRLPWSTEVMAEIDVLGRYDEASRERFVELRFTWKEFGRLTNSERTAHLFLYPGNTAARGDDAFAAAVSDQYDTLMTTLTNAADEPDVVQAPDHVRIRIAESSSSES